MWMVEAKEQGIDVWAQQPGETQWEYTIWLTYRDSYPGKKPSYQDVADQLQTTNSVVRGVASKWSFPARMQAWIAECDRITLQQRQQEIVDMNKANIEMAAKLRKKLSVAIDNIDELNLKPNEIVNLSKMTTEMERKARIDNLEQIPVEHKAVAAPPASKEDLSEVVDILLKAGALQVKHTTEVKVDKFIEGEAIECPTGKTQ